MCVIAIAYDQHPTDEQVQACYEANSHGAGIAWREGEGPDVKCCWEKGLDLQQVLAKYKELPLPYILHFRIPSCGPDTKVLCHPFPMVKSAFLSERGKVKGDLLFHNGHWGYWDTMLKDAVFKSRIKLPGDPWSDSRAMAWLAANFGMGMLELIPEAQRIAVLPVEGEILTYGDGWKFIDGVWFSNDYWVHRTHRRSLPPPGASEYFRTGPRAIYPADKRTPSGEGVADPVGAAEVAPKKGPFSKAEVEKMAFATVDRLYRESLKAGVQLISKNQWKKARKRWEALYKRRWMFEVKDYKLKRVTDAEVEKHLRWEEALARTEQDMKTTNLRPN